MNKERRITGKIKNDHFPNLNAGIVPPILIFKLEEA